MLFPFVQINCLTIDTLNFQKKIYRWYNTLVVIISSRKLQKESESKNWTQWL